MICVPSSYSQVKKRINEKTRFKLLFTQIPYEIFISSMLNTVKNILKSRRSSPIENISSVKEMIELINNMIDHQILRFLKSRISIFYWSS